MMIERTTRETFITKSEQRRPETNGEKTENQLETHSICVEHVEPERTHSRGTKKNSMDEGRAWLVCFASFVVLLVVIGQVNCSAVTFVALLDEFKASRASAAWVISLFASSPHTFGPVSTHLCQRFGCRKTAILGSTIYAIGYLSSAFSPNIYFLYFTYGIVSGFGASLCLCASLLILPQHFKRKLALANGLSLLGPPAGMLVLSHGLSGLFETLGFRYTFLILSGWQSIIVCAALTFRTNTVREEGCQNIDFHGNSECKKEIERMAPKPVKKNVNIILLKNRGYVLWVISLSLFIPALLVPYVHLIRYAEDKGINKSNAGFLLYFLAIGSVISRPIVGCLSDKWPSKRIRMLQLAFLSISVINTLIPLATNYAALATYSFIYGYMEGFIWTLLSVITNDIVGHENLPSALGWLLFVISFPEVSGAPLAGLIYDISKSYAVAFSASGAMVTVSSVVMFLIPHQRHLNATTKEELCLI